MDLIKTHKIHPVRVRPGDSIFLTYHFEDPPECYQQRLLKVDDFDQEMTIDTVIAYRTVEGEFGLKAGRALILGEDDGTYKDLPINPGKIPRIANG